MTTRALSASRPGLGKTSLFLIPTQCRLHFLRGFADSRRLVHVRLPIANAIGSPRKYDDQDSGPLLDRLASLQPRPPRRHAGSTSASRSRLGRVPAEDPEINAKEKSDAEWARFAEGIPNDALFCQPAHDPASLKLLKSELVSLVRETPWQLPPTHRYLYRAYTFSGPEPLFKFMDGLRAISGTKTGTQSEWTVAGTRVYLRWSTLRKAVYGISADAIKMVRQSDRVLQTLGEGVLFPNSDDGYRYSEAWARQERLIYPVVRKFSSKKKAWDHCLTLLKYAPECGRYKYPLIAKVDRFVYESQARFTTSPHYGVRVLVSTEKNERHRLMQVSKRAMDLLHPKNPIPSRLKHLTSEVSRDWKSHCPGYNLQEWDARVSQLEEEGQLCPFD